MQRSSVLTGLMCEILKKFYTIRFLVAIYDLVYPSEARNNYLNRMKSNLTSFGNQKEQHPTG